MANPLLTPDARVVGCLGRNDKKKNHDRGSGAPPTAHCVACEMSIVNENKRASKVKDQ